MQRGVWCTAGCVCLGVCILRGRGYLLPGRELCLSWGMHSREIVTAVGARILLEYILVAQNVLFVSFSEKCVLLIELSKYCDIRGVLTKKSDQ